MPFYEVLCLSPAQKELVLYKTKCYYFKAVIVARQSIKSIIESGGVVKKIECLGTNTLPYRMKRHQIIHDRATYFK